jgi:hypothetical protein
MGHGIAVLYSGSIMPGAPGLDFETWESTNLNGKV